MHFKMAKNKTSNDISQSKILILITTEKKMSNKKQNKNIFGHKILLM